MAEQPGLRFGRVAEEYERVRPGYSDTLVDRAYSLAGLRQGDTVGEIGCGTGKLTRALTARGLAVEAVEPDPDLIAVARRIVPEQAVRFHQARFEDVELPEGSFPAVFAATSFHWVDPSVGWSKVAGLLVPGGVFALFSHAGDHEPEMNSELRRVWEEATGRGWHPVDQETFWRGAEERRVNVSELWSWLTYHELADPEAAQLFEQVELSREPVAVDMSIEDYLARVRTTNNYLHLGAGAQERLERDLAAVIRDHGGVYPGRTFGVLVTARRAL